jgi:hypothetical protein
MMTFSFFQRGDKGKSLLRWREMEKWKGMKGAFIGIDRDMTPTHDERIIR